MNDCWHVYLYGIMWRTADANPELPENLRVTVDADSRADAIGSALEQASDEFDALIEGTEQIEATRR